MSDVNECEDPNLFECDETLVCNNKPGTEDYQDLIFQIEAEQKIQFFLKIIARHVLL